MNEQEAVQLTYWSVLEKQPSQLWQGYTPDMTDEKAEAAFVTKYGYKPAGKKRYASILLVGPLVEEARNV